MSFVYPEFLWAYFLVAIPIVVHLFNFRRYKNVYFSRVKFLKEVTEDSKSGVKLKHLFVLAARILTILALVTAFAQPFVPVDDSNNTENITSIFIDNSYSMEAVGSDGDLLNEVKNQSIELVRSLPENEKVNLITCDLLSSQQRFYTKGEVIDMIKLIDFSPRSTGLDVALNTQIDLLNQIEGNVNKRLFLFSDFQKTTSGLELFNRDEVSSYYFYKPETQVNGNIFIDSVWFLTPVHRLNSPIDLYFRVRNVSDISDSLSVSLSINGNEPGPKKVSVAPQSYTDSKITFTDYTAGIKSGLLKISTSQLFFDDEMYFTYEIKEKVNILIVKGKDDQNGNLEQLYALDDYYNFIATTIDKVTQEDFKDKELIIFQNVNSIPSGVKDLSDEAIQHGASIVIIPGTKADLGNLNAYFNSHNLPNLTVKDSSTVELTYFNDEDPLYAGVFESTPKSFKHPQLYDGYRMNTSSGQNFITLFGINAAIPYLIYAKTGNGRLITMASPLDIRYSNFQNHALFAATFLRFAETATFQKPIYMTIGEMVNFPLNVEVEEKNPIHLINKDLQVDVIPQIVRTNTSTAISFSQLEDQLKSAGFYQLTDQKDFNEMLGLNYSRKESYIESFSNEELIEHFASKGWGKMKELKQNDTGSIEINTIQADEYWRILIILALIFIAAEILLLKLWKT